MIFGEFPTFAQALASAVLGAPGRESRETDPLVGQSSDSALVCIIDLVQMSCFRFWGSEFFGPFGLIHFHVQTFSVQRQIHEFNALSFVSELGQHEPCVAHARVMSRVLF